MLLTDQGSLWPLKTIFEDAEILYSFRLDLKGKTGDEVTNSRLEFLEKFSAILL